MREILFFAKIMAGFFVTLLIFPLEASAVPVQRLALVIGNTAYSQRPLKNPANDAADLAAALKRLGFEVIERKNRNAEEMRRDVIEFQSRLKPGGVGLFYFAGHGVQAGRGQNYLLPVGMEFRREKDAELHGLEVGWVLRNMEDAGSSLSLVILDACRDSPLPAEGRSMNNRGLGRMEAPSGSLIAFATAPGSTADENLSARNGLYTQHLLKAIETPGLRLEDVFKRVRRGVEAASNRQQSPEEIMKLTSDEPFYFLSGQGATQVANAASAQQIEEQAWVTAKTLNVPDAYKAFLDEYPRSVYASAARIAMLSVPKPQGWASGNSPTPSAGKVFVDCPGCPKMVVVPAGLLPKSGKAMDKDLIIGKRFAVSVYEVTFREWDFCVTEGGCSADVSDEDWGRDSQPVINVSWDDARAFTAWLSKKTGRQYRLPRDAEWEYVARAGSSMPYPWGQYSGLDNANCLQCGAAGYAGKQSAPVGSYRPNAFGLHDVIGNVWEWTDDCDTIDMKSPDEAVSDIAAACASRILRGGSFKTAAQDATLDRRRSANRNTRSTQNGFRVVMDF